jgi:CheY-like chemotaxis protein
MDREPAVAGESDGAERRPRVLVVDDHDRTRTMLRGMIEGRKKTFEVTEACDGEDCLRVVREQPPFDLIFLDVDMPRLDGFGTCRELRALGVKSPIIFLTGRSELDDFRIGREAGADTYLKKPIVLGTLRSMLGLFTSGSLQRR